MAFLVWGLLVLWGLQAWERAIAPPPAPPPGDALVAAPWDEVAGLLRSPAGLDQWAAALEASAGYYAKRPAGSSYVFTVEAGNRLSSVEGGGRHPPSIKAHAGLTVDAAVMARACRELAGLARGGDAGLLLERLRRDYLLLRSIGSNGAGEVLVTGYYEPTLQGSREPSPRFAQPLYRRPPDLLEADLGAWFPELKGKRLVARVENGSLRPYHDRSAIDGGALRDRGLELVWVDDPVEAFILQIQGSGRVQMTDGSELRVGYDGANGHPYRAIGGLLVAEGHLTREELTLPALRQWLAQHPDQVTRVLHHNQSYIFFRALAGPALGNIQVPLTPGHSVATDHRLFPRGAPALLVTRRPLFDAEDSPTPRAWEPMARLVVNQDTGGAIRGAGRVDWFLGPGAEAERVAGVMKEAGSRLYFIAPRPGVPGASGQ
ncbi:MAG: MltA domain-containing protein [Magnetococcales bacterium]|nr:MltA domain-containing protein [Magnetococcales bacterium]